MTTAQQQQEEEATQIIKEIMDDKCSMELLEAEETTPQQWLKVETERLQRRDDAYSITSSGNTQAYSGRGEMRIGPENTLKIH